MFGKIRIATTHAMASYILTDILIDFYEVYPDVKFEIIADDNLIDIVQKEVEIGIRPYDPNNNDLIQKHLFTIERGLYASKCYIEKYGIPKTLEELDSHKFIARSRPDENPYSDVSWALTIGRHSQEPREASFTGTSSEALLKAAGRGVGITASYEEMEGHKKYNLVRILPHLAKQEQKQYLANSKTPNFGLRSFCSMLFIALISIFDTLDLLQKSFCSSPDARFSAPPEESDFTFAGGLLYPKCQIKSRALHPRTI